MHLVSETSREQCATKLNAMKKSNLCTNKPWIREKVLGPDQPDKASFHGSASRCSRPLSVASSAARSCRSASTAGSPPSRSTWHAGGAGVAVECLNCLKSHRPAYTLSNKKRGRLKYQQTSGRPVPATSVIIPRNRRSCLRDCLGGSSGDANNRFRYVYADG